MSSPDESPLQSAPFKQCAIVVRDLDAAVRRWHAQLGIGPWTGYRLEPPRLKEMRYHGEDAEFSIRHALAWQGELQFELVSRSRGRASSPTTSRRTARGCTTSASTSPTTRAAVAAALAAGFVPLQSARGFGAEGDGAFAYFQPPGIAADRRADRGSAGRGSSRSSSTLQAPLSARRWPETMRIESVEAIPAGSACYVRVTADDGTTGVGESTYFGWPTAVAEIVRSFGAYLAAAIRSTSSITGSLCTARSASAAWRSRARSARSTRRSGISRASITTPRLGSCSAGECARRCARCGSSTRAPRSRSSTRARAAVEEDGYTALKILLFQDDHHPMRQAARIGDLVASFAAIRETVGWDIDLGVELHRNMTAGDALLLCGELARFRPLFVEDPIPPDSVVALRAFAAKVGLPVAAGEREHDDLGVRRVPRAARDRVRPARRRDRRRDHARQEDLRPRRVVPRRHPPARRPSGPVAVAAHVQLGMCVPNWELQEHVPQDAPRWTDLVDRVIEVRDGYLLAPDRPGLGIELDDAGLARHPPQSADLRTPPLREDGSIAIR